MRDYLETVKRLRFFEEKSKALSMLTGWDDDGVTALSANAADAIEELLAERTAFWVDTQPHLDDSSYKKDGMSYYCSNCHHRAGKYKHRSYKFCPWCGAKIVPKETAIADMLPPLQIGEDADDLIEQVERFQEYVKGGAE